MVVWAQAPLVPGSPKATQTFNKIVVGVFLILVGQGLGPRVRVMFHYNRRRGAPREGGDEEE